jgi:hypothetical protein
MGIRTASHTTKTNRAEKAATRVNPIFPFRDSCCLKKRAMRYPFITTHPKSPARKLPATARRHGIFNRGDFSKSLIERAI